jgi:hypothetical protein
MKRYIMWKIKSENKCKKKVSSRPTYSYTITNLTGSFRAPALHKFAGIIIVVNLKNNKLFYNVGLYINFNLHVFPDANVA